jgi:undecaprenyl-diphosphatase
MAVTFYGLMIYILQLGTATDWIKMVITILLTALIVLIGFSRIYLRVHYASDVLGGFIIGLLWLMISLAVLKWLEGYVST